MKRSKVAMFLALLLAGPSPALWAQEAAQVEAPKAAQSSPVSEDSAQIGVGTEIRVTTIHQVLTGELLALDEHNVQLEVDENPVVLPRRAVVKWEVRSTDRANGALWGAALGAGLAGISMLGCLNPTDGEEVPAEGLDRACEDAGFFAKTAAISAGIGAVIGLAIGNKRWKVVSTERVEVAIGTQPGMGVSVSLSF